MLTDLFKTRFLAYLTGLLPLVALLLFMLRLLPQAVGLGLMGFGTVMTMWMQQNARKQYPYDFSRREEWLALGAYAVLVVALVIGVQVWAAR